MELSCRAQLTSGRIVKCEPVHDAFENGQHNDAYAYIIILKWYFDFMSVVNL